MPADSALSKIRMLIIKYHPNYTSPGTVYSVFDFTVL